MLIQIFDDKGRLTDIVQIEPYLKVSTKTVAEAVMKATDSYEGVEHMEVQVKE